MNPNHLYTSPGHYTVCLFIHDSISNCSAHSCLVFHSHQPPHHQALSNALFADELTPTGIEQINSQFEFKVYPNPLSTITNIEYTLEGNAKVKWELYNLIGEIVLSSKTKSQGTGQYVEQLDVNTLANGTYLVKLFINNQAAISKIIIMK